MGFLDRFLGRPDQGPPAPRPAPAPQRSDDDIAVERYEYLLRTAPPETIERVHTEAFGKLTPEQRDLLFARLSENPNPTERPADAAPDTLAKAATRTELQQPGTLTREFGGQGGMSFGGMVGSSLLGTVAGYVIGSALVSAFLPADPGADGGSDSADAADPSASDPSGGGGDAGGDGGAGGDSGGFGDFGGDFGF